jgi:hypothetical protein
VPNSGTCVASFDHLVGAGEECGPHGEAKCLRSIEVDHKLELGWLLNWDIAGLRSAQNLAPGASPTALNPPRDRMAGPNETLECWWAQYAQQRCRPGCQRVPGPQTTPAGGSTTTTAGAGATTTAPFW